MSSYKIAIIGEAYGEEEERYGKPFIGKAGQQLNELLSDAGIDRSECFITNVFNLRPDRNDIATLCCKKSEGEILFGKPALVRGLYLKSQYAPELERLSRELEEVQPNVVVLLGNTVCWAVLGRTSISKIRGTCSSEAGWKCLPTYHPAAVLRQYELRHITVLDLIKAKRESEFPELRRPRRELWLDPTLEEMERFLNAYISPAKRCAFDIETAFGQITCISFAPSIDRCIIVPFLDYRKPHGHYWTTHSEELEAWQWVKRALSTSAEKVGQNVLYDVQYLWRLYGIPVTNLAQDTMLLHHSLQPESQKSLGFLGSVYTNEIAWKPNRPKSRHTEKPQDSE